MPRTKVFLVGFVNRRINGNKLPLKRNGSNVLFYDMRVVVLNFTCKYVASYRRMFNFLEQNQNFHLKSFSLYKVFKISTTK